MTYYARPLRSDELQHYGILGMKWGQHRANKKGTTYEYKSMITKRYEKKSNKLAAKSDKLRNKAEGATKEKKANKLLKKADKQQSKSDTYSVKAKYSKELDSKLQKAANNQSVGKAVAKSILLGGTSNLKNYEIAKINTGGNKKKAAIGHLATTTLLGRGVGIPTAALHDLQRSTYITDRMNGRK